MKTSSAASPLIMSSGRGKGRGRQVTVCWLGPGAGGRHHWEVSLTKPESVGAGSTEVNGTSRSLFYQTETICEPSLLWGETKECR